MQSPEQRQAIVQRMIDAGESEQNIATVIQHFKTLAPETGRTTAGDLLDVGKGFVKGAGRVGLDVLNAAVSAAPFTGGIPSRLVSAVRNTDALKPTNQRQQAGMFGADVASFVTPAGAQAAGSRLLPRAAIALERRAVPALSKTGAEQVLSRGAGRVSAGNAKAMAAEAKATRAEIPKWNQRKGE